MGGGGTERHTAFSVRSKLKIGWISANQTKMVTSAGTYEIFANDDIRSRYKLLSLTIPYKKNSSQMVYYIEYARRLMDNAGKWMNGGGLIVRMGYSTYAKGNSTHLIDTKPNTVSESDAPIRIGQTFTSSSGDIRFKLTPKSQVCLPGSPCSVRVQVQIVTGRSARSLELTEPTSSTT